MTRPLSLRVRITAMFTLLYGALFLGFLAWLIDHIRSDLLSHAMDPLATPASRIEMIDHIFAETVAVLVVSIPATILVTVVAGYYLVRRLLRPIDRIIAQARRISSEHLDQRIPATGHTDEIGRLIEALNEMIERLELEFGRIEQFTANAAHELRTPLTILLSQLEVTLQHPRTDREYEDVLRSNLEEVRRIARSVEQLLLLARMEASRIPLDREPVSLRLLLEEVHAHMLMMAHPRGIALTLRAARDVDVVGDPALLAQLLMNLVENAIKYNRDGGSVALELVIDADMAVILVKDSGIGIPASSHERIFERFYREKDGRSSAQPGTGLGLPIARWIARAHGGELRVASAVGSGSEFSLILPLAVHASAPSTG